MKKKIVFALILLAFVAPFSFGDDDEDTQNKGSDWHDGKIVIDLSDIGEAIAHIAEALSNSLGGVMESVSEALSNVGEINIDIGHLGKVEAGVTQPVKESKHVQGDVEVDISNIAGKVEIIGWDRNEVEVEGTLGEEVERLEFEVDGDRVEIEVIVPRKGRKRLIRSELVIHVPIKSTLRVETISASIIVSKVTGRDIELESVSGSLSVSDAEGDVSAETVSGAVEVSGKPKRVEAESVSGSVKVDGVTERLEASSISGSIHVQGSGLERCELESVSGEINFGGGLNADGRIQAESFSGHVLIQLDKNVSARFDLETFSGNIQCDFGPESKGSSSGRRGKELSFTQGDGDGSVDVETFSGAVEIRSS